MKNILTGLLFLWGSALAGQMVVTRTVSTVLEKYENKWRHWGGDLETVTVAAVRTVSGSDSSNTMQIRVTNKDWEKVGASSGWAVGGGGGWAVGGSSIEKVTNQTGFVVMHKAEAAAWVAFLQEIIVAGSPDRETTISLSIGERFVFSAVYGTRWKYVLTVDGASFELLEADITALYIKVSMISVLVD
jgi:hypothetical protein